MRFSVNKIFKATIVIKCKQKWFEKHAEPLTLMKFKEKKFMVKSFAGNITYSGTINTKHLGKSNHRRVNFKLSKR
jgi:hypothetical protein